MTGLITAITSVWSDIMTWITDALGSSGIQSLFWTTAEGGAGSLTFLGVMSVVSIGIGVVFLLISVITNFIKLRA